MTWNWQNADWPNFRYDAPSLTLLERKFLQSAGEVIGAVRHFNEDDSNQLRIELLSDEAVKTSEIEGEFLDRVSVQSSLRRQFGLNADDRQVRPQERGIAEMMADVYRSWHSPLGHEGLFHWHSMLMAGNRYIETIGAYREHEDAMQIVSGRLDKPAIHFEAPPSRQVHAEMENFIAWFNQSGPNGRTPLQALTRAAVGHLYFESIHPFEDGNGRIGRALAEKSLAQNIGQPSLISLAFTIEKSRKAYYSELERHQRTLDITDWIIFFSETILEAQRATLDRINFFIQKAKFYDRFRNRLNERQQKVVARIFKEGTSGFKGGLSAENYISITGTSRATATRDLQQLVEIGAFTRTGELRHTRYSLAWQK
ncbi:Fic family protein [Pseudorhizobium pelagicum]|uniref:Cell division protein Fic n=1 Tax=Pseudorhizobium pelagicum TaxID=1509405 RepID=A0A922NYA1_9HYPH|nr:Fic family protein [Pseudorhizobium pelagicum]KEQ02768.1 cell division protein Fic [Pseudorhizobium pelagicum]KEQ04854.1 cell division protein Fic [Pseudorhizobium pelagicum]